MGKLGERKIELGREEVKRYGMSRRKWERQSDREEYREWR